MAVETASEETPMRLEGKTALVTGGASGFGAGIVRKFLAEGARVAIADINADAANDFATGLGENAFAVAVDVSRNDSVEAMAESVLDRFGGLDILVNNAGVTHLPAAMEDISEEDFDRVLAVNTKSVYLTARHFVPVMKQKARGRYSQRRLHRRRQPAAAAELVQLVQGLDDHRDQIDGGRTGAVRRARQRHQPGGGRDAAAQVLHGRGHAGNPRQVPLDHSTGPVFHARGHGQCRLFPLFR
jgi:NAD(P)-dependent dehydrogenase (short-subunit alcohol dehydrogenase family)